MHSQQLVQRCLQLAEHLDQSYAWHLTAEQRRHYAERVGTLVGGQEMSEAALTSMLTYYHTEHPLVEALINSESSLHGAAWKQIEGQVRGLLGSKLAGDSQGDGAVGLDDLVQDAIADLWRGLQSFRYQSRLQTWVFTVASHCLNRTIRARRAQKRASMAGAQSLEAMTEALGDTLPDLREPTPEELVGARQLGQLLEQILARHPDRRLAVIIQLWAVEERPLREIGTSLQLSVGRVHGLLAQAQALLRASPSLQEWAASTTEQESAVGKPPALPGTSPYEG